MKKVSIILMTIGMILTMTGFGMQSLKSFKEDREKTLANMDKITEEYKVYSDFVDQFNEIRNYLYLEVFNNIYFDSMELNDAKIKEQFTTYEKTVTDVTKSTKKLNELCGNAYFPNNGVNTKCKSHGTAYEQMVNGFVTDVNLYNSHIKKYNDYQKENNIPKKIDNIKTDKKYIDYNKDKKYDGKEE